jgi:hypothetical protein
LESEKAALFPTFRTNPNVDGVETAISCQNVFDDYIANPQIAREL